MKDAIKLLNKGLEMVKAEKYEDSLDVLKAALTMNINDDLKKIILFQSAICLMKMGNNKDAEGYLLKYLDISEDLEAYDLLSEIYRLTEKPEKELTIYERVYELSPVGSGKLEAFIRVFELAQKLMNVEKALYWFDSYAATLTEEEKKESLIYKEMLSYAFSLTVYSEHHSYEKQIELMGEVYHLSKPERVNTFERDKSFSRDINIGFLSSDFSFHPVGRFLFSLFKDNIKDNGIKYFCYYTNIKQKTDFVTDAIKKGSYKFIEIDGMADEDIEKTILDDKLDILIDLNGISANNKKELISKRVAPVQLTWIGGPCTSAVVNVDYTIVDPVSDPTPYSQRFYTEKLVYMEKTFLCYPVLYKKGRWPIKASEPPFRKNGYITFASFVNALKYTDKILTAWAAILEKVTNSRLAIRGVVGTMDEISMNGLKRRFIKNGVDISKVDFLKPVVFNDYLASYNNVDIILDTFPFNGATTTCDAFLMGVPVVSIYGVRHHERVGLSMLKNVGLEDLAVRSVDEYVEKAVQLSGDGERLSELKKTLTGTFRNSPLTDTLSFKAEFESIMRKLHRKHI